MEEIQIVAFRLDNEEYGVNILNVQEIIRPTEITRVPKAPAYITGVINLRGNVIPVMNLRQRFGIQGEMQNDSNTRIIILNLQDVNIGIFVDSVSEVIRLSGEEIEEPNLVEALDDKFVQAVGKYNGRLIILLDLNQLLDVNNEKAHTLSSRSE
ncbi:MAG: chemotaxis protein CheW [Clostridia bacterium]|nr:chemotaxis protein CheW [Clostridia bacterium]